MVRRLLAGAIGILALCAMLTWALIAFISLQFFGDQLDEGVACDPAKPVLGTVLVVVAAMGIGVCVWGLFRAVPVAAGRRADWAFLFSVPATFLLSGVVLLAFLPFAPSFEGVPLAECPGLQEEVHPPSGG